MTVRPRFSRVPDIAFSEARQARLRVLNDGLRRYSRAGIICITAGIRNLGQHHLEAVLEGVRNFDQFDDTNDPHHEHDLGILKIAGERVMWKIDYYDRDRRFASPDPADPHVTTRVLTIMLASEY